jgi:hypothetical protein
MIMEYVNSQVNNSKQEYKKCARRGCEKLGTITLKVRYVNKIGHFCDGCTEELTNQDLVFQIGDDYK